MIFDLHSHTVFSDGALGPRELILRAVAKGVDVLAITDHDSIDAYADIPVAGSGLKIVPGIELSTQWQATGIHILGLNIDPLSDAIIAAARVQAETRRQRARRIAENLAKKGIEGAFEGAMQLSPGSYIGRPHFAQYLINIGRADSMHSAFKKYLGDGKAGDVKKQWAELPQIIQWIRDAGGIAVLAHPLKYKLTRTRLKRLLEVFIAGGGEGMEVISGQQTVQQTREMAQLCQEKKLLASCGSDFHMPGTPWAELGVFAALPKNVIPVWDRFCN